MKTKIWSVVHRAGGVTVASVVGGLALALTALVILGLASGGGTTSATDVTPKFVAGNPSCEDLGHTNEKKVEPVVDGTFSLGFDGGTVTLVVDEGAKTFDWTSTLPMNTVLVKGGPNANAYNYQSSSFGDDGLHAPEQRNGRFAGLSHVSFCFKKAVVNPTPTPSLVTGNIAFEINLNTGQVIPCTGSGEITIQTTKVVENEGSSSYTYDVSGLIDGTCTGLGAFVLSFAEGSQGACKGTEGAAGPFQCTGKNIVDIVGDTVGEITVSSAYKCPNVFPDGDDLLLCAGTGQIDIGIGIIKGFTFVEKPTPTPDKCTDRKGCPTPTPKDPKPTATPGDPEPPR